MVPRIPVACDAALHLDRLPRATRRAFSRCTTLAFLSKSGWYLAGGTALAIQVGHRQSMDLDFFTPQQRFQIETLQRYLMDAGPWELSHTERGTLYGSFEGTKMSFIAYPFFRPSPQRLRCGAIRVLVPSDIAAMKIIAISQRGTKRDFVDLYWLVTHGEQMSDVVRRAARQYPGQEHNLPHIVKSLTYFVDADEDKMPRCFFNANWRTIKSYFQREAPKVARELLGLT